MPDPRIFPVVRTEDYAAGVTDASAIVIPANPHRVDIEIVNDLATVVYLSRSNPAVVGVRILDGKLISGMELIKADGSKCSYVKSMQSESENVTEAKKNDELAISIPKVTVGRQIDENDVLFVDVSENDFKKLKGMKKLLNKGEIDVLKELAEIKRKEKGMWGI